MIKVISITGPESTGKSWLARSLADFYSEPWVPEYAREYLGKLKRPYDFNDILKIAQEQYAAELRLMKNAKDWLFCDTDFLVTHIWSKVKYGKSHLWIEEMLHSHKYHHYLLCNTDLPWEEDPLREHPGYRHELFEMYRFELQRLNLPFTIVSGQGNDRMTSALNVLQNQLK